MTGVSLGGSVANVAAVIAAGNCDTGVGSCPVVATSSATSFLTGVLHNRIAWNVLSEAEDAVADEIKAVVAGVARRRREVETGHPRERKGAAADADGGCARGHDGLPVHVDDDPAHGARAEIRTAWRCRCWTR